MFVAEILKYRSVLLREMKVSKMSFAFNVHVLLNAFSKSIKNELSVCLRGQVAVINSKFI